MKIIKKLSQTELEDLNIGEKLNKQVLFLLPRGIIWYRILLKRDEINDLRIINDKSWPKEYPSAGTVGEIVKIILSGKAVERHTTIIKKIAAKSGKPTKGLLVILLARDLEDTYTIIDGHHRLIAELLKGEVDKIEAILGIFGKRKCVLVR